MILTFIWSIQSFYKLDKILIRRLFLLIDFTATFKTKIQKFDTNYE